SIPCSLSFSASSSWVSIGYFSMSSSIFACLVYFIFFKILSPEIDFCSEYVKEVDFPDLDKVDGIAGFPHADVIPVRDLVSLATVKGNHRVVVKTIRDHGFYHAVGFSDER